MAEQGKSRRRILREIQFMQQQTKSGEPINIKKMQEYLNNAINRKPTNSITISFPQDRSIIEKVRSIFC